MIEFNKFEHYFKKYKSSKVVLYGIGIKTKEIVETVDFNIIGLMDRNPQNIGKEYFGIKVLSIDEVIEQADIIIIMSANVYFKTIFERIEFLNKEHQIPIYFCDGNEAKSYGKESNIQENLYWNKNLKGLKKEIDKNEIISFDIFDTLITRKITEPIDLLLMIEKKEGYDSDFLRLRIDSELELGNEGTLKEIYTKLPTKYKLAYFIEREFELSLSVVRYDMLKAFNYAIEQKKDVYLITDIYHDKAFIMQLLEQSNIKGYKDILISCELKMRKSDKSLWRYYKKIIGNKSALHIGDNMTSDIKNAEIFGINTYHILSPYEMLKNSTLRGIVSKICTLDESILIGNIISQIFNSPFSLEITKGQPKFTHLEELGYVFFAPILFNYIIWIIKKNIENNTDTILFVARDGYFLEKLYNFVKEQMKIYNAPKAQYLMISRVIASIITIEREEDLEERLNIKFYGTLTNYFKIRFGIQVDGKELINTLTDIDKIRYLVNINKSRILKNSKEQRDLYLSYLDEKIKEKENITIVDPSYNGTIQFFLSKILKKNLKGYYCTANLSKDNKYYKDNMFALFQSQDDEKAEKSNFRKNTVFLEEGILVAPEGTCLSITKELNFEFTPKGKTQENFKDKEEIYKGIRKFFMDTIQNYNTIDDIKVSTEFVDFMIGEIFSDKTLLASEIKDKFYYDSVYEEIKEGKVFE
jgi:predicted HAD superfamily hydrolase